VTVLGAPPPAGASPADIASLASEFESLREAFIVVVESTRGRIAPDGSYEDWPERLALKLLCHASTAFQLAKGTEITRNVRVVDHSSVAVLARACIDVCSLMQYTFVETMSDRELRRVRFHAWELSDLLRRQRFPEPSADAAAVLAAEKEQIEAIRKRLAGHQYFAAKAKEGELSQVLKGSQLPGWDSARLMGGAGFGASTSKFYWQHSSSHVHSGRSALLQVENAMRNGDANADLAAPLRLVMFALALFVRQFEVLFEPARTALDSRGNLSGVVDIYAAVARK
jgi:hypothetical protein